MNIAIISNNIIENVVIVDDESMMQTLFPDTDYLVLEENDSKGIAWFRENNVWYPPKPYDDAVWSVTHSTWLTPEELERITNNSKTDTIDNSEMPN